MSENRIPIKDEFTIEDIGATLLNELSESLYEPEHVIREYIQNAVDAHKLVRDLEGSLPEEPILVQIRPDSISIIDYGIGMDQREVASVKGISISKKGKNGSDLTGQKGVGIWSGLSFFEKMVIETTKAGIDKKFILTIYFGKILTKLKSIDADTMSVGQVLNGNHLLEMIDADEEEHGTTVTLHTPRQDQASIFLDTDKIRDSIRKYAPCDIDPDFKFYEELKKWYIDNNLSFIPISVGQNDVYKSYHNGLSKFSTGVISVGDKTVVKYWLALTDSNNKIPVDPKKIPSGFAFIQNGFSLDRNYGTRAIGSLPELENPYLSWYVGEMHVTNEYVLPNLNRKGLQLNDNALKLIDNLREWYSNLDSGTRQIAAIRKQTEIYKAFLPKAENILDLIIKGVPPEKSAKAAEEFEAEYEKESKRLSQVGNQDKYPNFCLHSYQVILRREMNAELRKLNIKWNEIRQDKIEFPTLAQIAKNEPKSKIKGKAVTQPVPQPSKPSDPITTSEKDNTGYIGEPPSKSTKIDLTPEISISLLRESMEALDPPLFSKTVMEKVVKNYTKVLRGLLGDV